MKERLKSIILVLLILLNLFLTYQLWFGQRPEEEIGEDFYEPVLFEEPRLLDDMVTPRKILFYRNDLLYKFKYGETDFQLLWNGASGLLQELTRLVQSGFDEKPPVEAVPCLVLQFSPSLPTGPGTQFFNENGYRELAEIIFERLDDKFWLVIREAGADTGMAFRLPREQEHVLEELCSSILMEGKVTYRKLHAGDLPGELDLEITVAGDLYVPESDLLMHELILKQENLDQAMLVQTFFVDPSLVRVIAERDGALIYTDGEKGLRLSGGLDFSHPQLELQPATSTYVAALHSAGKFLAYHGGWPEGVRLEVLHRDRRGGAEEAYRAYWHSYYQGFPFLAGASIQMTFNDIGMVEYRRNLHVPQKNAGETITPANYREAFEAALEVYRDQVEGTVAAVELSEITLGYGIAASNTISHGVPVWLVRLNGTDFLLRAKDLDLFEEAAP